MKCRISVQWSSLVFVIFLGICELSCREMPNLGHPSRHGLVSWLLGSCFKSSQILVNFHVERYLIKVVIPHVDLHHILASWSHHSVYNILLLGWICCGFCCIHAGFCHSSIFKLGSWYTGIIIPVWVLSIRGNLLLQRVADHLFPSGGLFTFDDLPPPDFSGSICPCETFFPQRQSRAAQPITTLSFVSFLPRVRRLTTAVHIWLLFLSHGYTLHQPRGVWLH